MRNDPGRVLAVWCVAVFLLSIAAPFVARSDDTDECVLACMADDEDRAPASEIDCAQLCADDGCEALCGDSEECLTTCNPDDER